MGHNELANMVLKQFARIESVQANSNTHPTVHEVVVQ